MINASVGFSFILNHSPYWKEKHVIFQQENCKALFGPKSVQYPRQTTVLKMHGNQTAETHTEVMLRHHRVTREAKLVSLYSHATDEKSVESASSFGFIFLYVCSTWVLIYSFLLTKVMWNISACININLFWLCDKSDVRSVQVYEHVHLFFFFANLLL